MDKTITPYKGPLLTFQPPNYHTWQGLFMTQCQSQFSMLARSLPTGRLPDYAAEFQKTKEFSKMPSSVQFPLSARSALPKTDAEDEASSGVSTPPRSLDETRLGSSTARTRAAAKQIEEESKYAEDCRYRDTLRLPALWSYIISALSELSFDIVQIHEGYDAALENCDVYSLWAIIAITHPSGTLGGTEMQIAVAEANLRQLPAEGKDFLQFTKEFRNLLKVAKDLDSSISNGQVVATYLKALLGTPLERKVLSLLDDPLGRISRYHRQSGRDHD
jgi:hypothetical protein